jgi:hypothetical protein
LQFEIFMKIFISFLFCLFILPSQGQMVEVKEKPSGYFGKRFAVEFSSSLGLSYNLQKATSTIEDYGITLNKEFLFYLQYTVKSDLSFGIVAGTSSTSFNASRSFEGTTEMRNGIDLSDNKGTFYRLRNINGSPSIKDITAGLEFRKFRSNKGAFSPLGQYFNYGIIAHQYSVDLSLMSFDCYIPDKNNSNTRLYSATPTSKKILPELFVGGGFARPVFKSLLFDATLKLVFLVIFKDQIGSESVDELGYIFELKLYEGLRNREIININLGLSYPF